MADEYMDTSKLKLDYMPQPEMINGIQTFLTANDMYLYCTRDALMNGQTISRKGRLYKSIKPYALRVENTEYPYIMLPGSCYHDTPAWMMWELLDFILGEEVVGGYAVAWDKHRRTVYPKANGDSDWAYKKALGRMNENQLEWAQRSLRMDSASRNCVIAPWHAERDLKQYVANKELDQQRGDTYQRLPCITTIQFSQREGGKGLDSFQYQRSLDFTGAIHTDLWRFSEIADYLARTSYPGGHGGSTTIFVGTLAIESYGAAAFVKFNKALEWWCNEPGLRSLQYCWPSNKYGLWLYEEEPIANVDPNKPKQKQYDYYAQEIENLAQAARCFYWCRFEEGLANLANVHYQYYRDWANALMAFSAQRLLERREQLESSLYDSKKIKAALDWIDGKLNDNPNWFIQQVTNYYQYHVMVETARYLITTEQYGKLYDITPYNAADINDWLMIAVLIDAFLYTTGRQRAKLRKAEPPYAEVIDLYESIFA